LNANKTRDVGVANTPGQSIRAEKPATARSAELKQSYAKLVSTIQQLVKLTIPYPSTILVISKGDEELLDLGDHVAWHFPRAVNGKFAGCYPATSAEAIDQLEMLRIKGADYLLIPSTSFWWLEFYTNFTTHLQQNYRIVTYQEDVCIVYRLSESHANSGNKE
jgi:hypothetical protein